MIKIEQKSDDVFMVTVLADDETQHEVTLDDAYYEELTCSKIDKEELIRRSFVFLLGRESNTEILTSFHLKKIQEYFPDFEKTTKKLCAA